MKHIPHSATSSREWDNWGGVCTNLLPKINTQGHPRANNSTTCRGVNDNAMILGLELPLYTWYPRLQILQEQPFNMTCQSSEKQSATASHRFPKQHHQHHDKTDLGSQPTWKVWFSSRCFASALLGICLFESMSSPQHFKKFGRHQEDSALSQHHACCETYCTPVAFPSYPIQCTEKHM